MIRRIKMLLGRIILKILPLQVFPKLNRLCYVMMGHQVGKRVVLYSSVEMLGLIQVSIGDGSFVGHGTLFMGGVSRISIGRNCDISSKVSLIAGSHEIGNAERRAGTGISRNITIGDGVWIGYGSTLLGGVSIGNGAIIAAGSVVVQSVPAHTVYGGVPAKQIRVLDV